MSVVHAAGQNEEERGGAEAPGVHRSPQREQREPPVSLFSKIALFFPEGSRGMERTVVMDKSKGEPVISVKTTSRSKERVSIAFSPSPVDLWVV